MLVMIRADEVCSDNLPLKKSPYEVHIQFAHVFASGAPMFTAFH